MNQLPDLPTLAKCIDHAVLSPVAGAAELAAGVEVARRWSVACLCVKPCHVERAVSLLAGSGVLVGTVISFPHGSETPSIKAAQARAALEAGADELDMVLNIAALREGDLAGVESDIRAVVTAAGGACVKVILECALLNDEQKVAGCRAAEAAGASFVKTSTGFAPTGATVADVELLRQTVPARMGVKASGGIGTLEQAQQMLAAGATRIGTSHTENILLPQTRPHS